MTQENKNEKWCVVSAWNKVAVYPNSKFNPNYGWLCSTERLILPEADEKRFRKAYEYIVKLHNDRLRFKQKQRNKKKNRSHYTELNKNPSPADGWIVGGGPVDDSKKKTCIRCKQCKDGCEFYDNGICRGVVYPTNPPQYGKCEFDK